MNEKSNIHAQTIINRSWNPVARRFDYSFGFAFRTREEYLLFRCSWKENYLALSKVIRSQRELVKSTMRRTEYAGKLQIDAIGQRVEANLQMLMLKAAKEEAGRQWLAARKVAK